MKVIDLNEVRPSSEAAFWLPASSEVWLSSLYSMMASSQPQAPPLTAPPSRR